MKRIFLNKGLFTVVDDEDYRSLSQYHWYVNCNGYVIRKPPRLGRKERPTIFMHREILEIPNGLFSDHINGDRLDNRRCNLRIATSSQNNSNRGVSVHNKLGVKGVTFDASRNKFRARVKLNREVVYTGRFDTLEEARLAYRQKAKQFHGEFARTE